MGDLLLVNESVTVQGKRKFAALKLSKESWWNTQANTNLVYVGVHREVTKLSWIYRKCVHYLYLKEEIINRVFVTIAAVLHPNFDT